jgi:hypothetical protein
MIRPPPWVRRCGSAARISVDLVVGQFFGGAVGHLQHFRAERVRVAVGEVGDFRGVADGADHAVAAVEQLAGQFAAESAADAGDEPGPRVMSLAFRCGRRG